MKFYWELLLLLFFCVFGGPVCSGTDIPPPVPPSCAQGVQAKRSRILLADDHDFMGPALAKMLEAIGYEVKLVVDGRQALEEFRQHKEEYVLLISDEQMPHLSGTELINLIRTTDLSFPVLLVSGFNETVIPSWLEANRVEYLTKPFKLETLEQLLVQILKPPPSTPRSGK